MSGYKASDSSSTTALMPSSQAYIKSGIGGAGNYHKSSTIQIHVTQPKAILRRNGIFLTGIGGFGNSRSYEERAQIPYEEEFAREQLRRESRPSSFHHGIGGAGNFSTSFDESRRASKASSLANSDYSSSQSGSEKVKEKLAWLFKN